jgi:hypothetical protein
MVKNRDFIEARRATVSPEATAARLLSDERIEKTGRVVRICLDALGDEWLTDLARALNAQWQSRHPSISHVRILLGSDDARLCRALSAVGRPNVGAATDEAVGEGYADIFIHR